MSSDEIRKKWGTIFMGEREASVEQLRAMQTPLQKEREKKEQTEDYMERVKARAADRAREILGAAYTERQNVLQEARNEIAVLKRQAAEECARLKAEGEAALKQAQAELAAAQAERQAAEEIKSAAHDEGFQNGMDKAGEELKEFRTELGQSLAALLGAVERQCGHVVDTWREELVALTLVAVQAGTGFILKKEHGEILRNLVFQALELLENRNIITVRVNPEDEAQVSDMFRAARERAPELKQWIVTGDASIEPGGLVAESGSGSVDLQRQNFREMVSDILVHLGLPPTADASEAAAMRELLEREVAHIASLTPEADLPLPPEAAQSIPETPEWTEAPEIPEVLGEPDIPVFTEEELPTSMPDGMQLDAPEPEMPSDFVENGDSFSQWEEPGEAQAAAQPAEETPTMPTLEELEEELFPLDEEEAPQARPENAPDPKAQQEGGFL